MDTITLKFQSLQHLAEFMYAHSLRKPAINYDKCTLTSQLRPEQVEQAKKYKAEVVAKNGSQL